ncbi:MAG: thioredoxin family protein [Parabacteroides sp.]|jgi:small redox-active disulfide protein 2|uniref:thioredoxin family protein n=1 Tax=Macellibacteroides sp. TaxID=2014584 RepID=UPI00092ABC3C|nr:TM0996/MTH895 family glutaredoxin-like protein [Parabacteroides sp.]MDD4433436.1 thioredoxin family protein [Parabacteroides sp.]OJV92235.1 MAG: thioredoxin family protein [Bacteroidia bacterium 44-10]
MEIKILGTGCAKCKTLEKVTKEVVEQNKLDATISKVEDIMEIMKYNVMSTPALVVNESVEVKGRIPSADEIKQILLKY